LRLFNNQLTAVPAELGQLAGLATLYLDDAQRATLPPASKQVLADLEVAGCQIEEQ